MAPPKKKVKSCRVNMQRAADRLQMIRQIDSVLELRCEIERVLTENENLKEMVEKLKELKAKAESDIEKVEDAMKLLKVESEEGKQRREELENRINGLIESSPKPVVGYRKFADLKGVKMKNVRCRAVIEWLQSQMDEEDVDQFLVYFVTYVSNCEKFSFRLSLSAEDTALAKMRFALSDAFLKAFKSFFVDRLGHDVFASRADADRIVTTIDVDMYYQMDVIHSERTLPSGRTVTLKTTATTHIDIVAHLSSRLAVISLFENLVFDEGEEDIITLGVAGDKGGDSTKLVLIIRNTARPSNPDGLMLIGMYAGPDNHASLEEHLRPVFDQLNNLKEIDYEEKSGRKVRKIVKLVPIGDCLFVSALFHLKGPSSSHPCFICLFSLCTHGSGKALVKTAPFERAHDARELHDRRREDHRPLLLVEPEDVPPPGIHTILGVAQKYIVDALVAEARKLDCEDVGIPSSVKEQKELLKHLDDQMTHDNEKTTGLQRVESMLLNIVSAYEKLQKKMQRGRPIPRREIDCSSTHCLASCLPKRFPQKAVVFICTGCSRTFHAYCENVYDDVSDPFFCQTCSLGEAPGVSDRVTFVALKLRTVRAEIADVEQRIADVGEERDAISNSIRPAAGGYRDRLEHAMRSVGADVRAWYQDLTGNQIRSLLRVDSIQHVLAVFPASERIDLLSSLMHSLAAIMSNADNRSKSPEEIDEIECIIDNFVETIRLLHPDEGVTLKLHLLCAHLVPYLRRHGSWGRLSEQGIEALHAVINRLNRTYAAVKDPVQKTRLLLRNQMNRNVLYDMGVSSRR